MDLKGIRDSETGFAIVSTVKILSLGLHYVLHNRQKNCLHMQ